MTDPELLQLLKDLNDNRQRLMDTTAAHLSSGAASSTEGMVKMLTDQIVGLIDIVGGQHSALVELSSRSIRLEESR